MNAGIRRIGAGKASIISTTGPIGTLALAFIILHESVTISQLAGTLLVLAGAYRGVLIFIDVLVGYTNAIDDIMA